MGDASTVSQNEPIPPQGIDPNMGGDPGMMGVDPNMGGDPGMMDADPNMNMGHGGEDSVDRARKEIQKNIGKACADFRNYQGQDKEDLTKWVEGMLDSILDDSDAGIGEESEIDIQNTPTPQTESVIFTKKQLNKINEQLGGENLLSDKDEQKKEKKQNIKKNKNTPFSNPNFNS